MYFSHGIHSLLKTRLGSSLVFETSSDDTGLSGNSIVPISSNPQIEIISGIEDFNLARPIADVSV